MMYGITYRGRQSSEFGVIARATTRPVLAPVRVVEETVPYRDGTLDYSDAGGRLFYDDKVVEVEITVISPELRKTNRRVSDIVGWLAGGFGELIFDDMPYTCWIAKPIEISELSVELYRIGKATVQFRCKPFNRFMFTSRGIPIGSEIRLGTKIKLGYGKDSVLSLVNGTTSAVTYNYIGDAPVRPNILLEGVASSITLTVNGSQLKIDSLPKSFDGYGGVVIDNENWRVCGKDGTALTPYSSGEFIELCPGGNLITVKADAKGTLTLDFYPKYLYGSGFDA